MTTLDHGLISEAQTHMKSNSRTINMCLSRLVSNYKLASTLDRDLFCAVERVLTAYVTMRRCGKHVTINNIKTNLKGTLQ